MNEKFVKIDGNKIRYLESGNSNKTIILVHGLGASAQRWEHVIPLFNNDYRVIAPDLIGFGYSDKPSVDYTLEFFLQFFSNFLQKLGIKKSNIIGSSLGGQIVTEYCATDETEVEKLILVSPSGAMKMTTPALDAYIMAALYPSRDAAKNAFQMMAGPGKKIERHIIDGFVERMSLPNAKMAFMSTLLSLKNAELITNKLTKISVPTLIIWGERDPVIPIKYADSFVSAIKDCRFYRIDGSGHTPYVDNPKEFYKLVRGFLTNNR
ncbi:MAG: alpha/beta hydrolase [Thaumarchaeota archaeon]|nr:alpha/beta hydrolase [Nitrososphaerota archaeon]GFN39552.1 MAG: alpha/beta hydrolase [Marine Group I thaumarchaeote]